MNPQKTNLHAALITLVLFVTSCSALPPAELQATIDASVKATTDTQQSINATIDASVNATIQAHPYQQSETITEVFTPQSPTNTAVNLVQITQTSSELVHCGSELPSQTCYNTPAIYPDQFYLTVWIKNYDPNSEFYVKIGEVQLLCMPASLYHDRQSISCSTESKLKGEYKIGLFSADAILLSSGEISIYIPPTPVSTPTKHKPANQPTEIPSYPNP